MVNLGNRLADALASEIRCALAERGSGLGIAISVWRDYGVGPQ